MSITTRLPYKNAGTVLHELKILVKATQDLKSISTLTTSEKDELSEFLVFFDELKTKYQAVISQGDKLYEERPKGLISAAINRFNKIDSEILIENQNFQRRINTQKTKVEELRKQNFTPEEIEIICPAITEVDHEELAAKIKSLQIEKEKLKKFFSDAPRYDTALLDGTAIGESVTLNAKN